MPSPTYTPLATLTLGSSASSITFSSISQAYRDLVLVVNGSSSSLVELLLTMNGSPGSAYSRIHMRGNGTAVGAATSSGVSSSRAVSFSELNSPSSFMLKVDVLDYSATDKHKTYISRYDSSGKETAVSCTRFGNTSAITSLVLSGGTFDAGSTFALYGIVA